MARIASHPIQRDGDANMPNSFRWPLDPSSRPTVTRCAVRQGVEWSCQQPRAPDWALAIAGNKRPSDGSAGGLLIDLAGRCARRSRDLSEAESCHLSSRQVSWLAGGGLSRALPIDTRSVDSGRQLSSLLTRSSEPRLQWRYRVGISPTSLFSRDGHLDEYCCA